MTSDAARHVHVAADAAPLARPGVLLVDGISVVEADPALQQAIAAAIAACVPSPALAEMTTLVRAMYKRMGIDPTKTRPSSEALWRRVRKGEPFPQVNSLVDVINWCSFETQLPFGLYDRDRIEGTITLRRGQVGEQYAGIRKDTVHVAERLVLADDHGAFGNPTSDSARTKVTTGTRRALVIIFAPVQASPALVDEALALTESRIGTYCRAKQ